MNDALLVLGALTVAVGLALIDWRLALVFVGVVLLRAGGAV